MDRKYIKALTITFILTIGMIGVVSGFNNTNEPKTSDTKTSIEAKECNHEDADKCDKHSSEKCKYADNQATKISGSCSKTKMAEAKSCEMKSDKKCTKSIEGSNKTI